MFQLTSNWSVQSSSSADKCPAPPCRTAQNQVLSAYCEATRAGCDAVRNIVLHASVCEVSNAADHSSLLPLPMGASMSCAMSLMSQKPSQRTIKSSSNCVLRKKTLQPTPLASSCKAVRHPKTASFPRPSPMQLSASPRTSS